MNTKVQEITSKPLVGLLHEAESRLTSNNSPTLVSLTQQFSKDIDLLDFFCAAERLVWKRTVWSQPSKKYTSVGIGSAFTITGSGPNRFSKMRRQHKEIIGNAIIESPDPLRLGPTFFGGFRFDIEGIKSSDWHNYPDGLFILPRFAFHSSQEDCWITTNVMMDSESNPEAIYASVSKEWHNLRAAINPKPTAPSNVFSLNVLEAPSWENSVNLALSLIDQGKLDKVVLARRTEVNSEQPIDSSVALVNLGKTHPECMIFAVGLGSSTFLGATPELLVKLENGKVTATSLAGSSARGKTDSQDMRFEAELLSKEKDLREHAHVVDAIKTSLGNLCTTIDWDQNPSIVKLETVQHLMTTFRATTDPHRHLLELAELLHPTPAVGGTPQNHALAAIRLLEQWDRGWYGGAVGRLDQSGNGELGIAIRSGLVKNKRALLFAGAGIVDGSSPQGEWDETELKFKPLLHALCELD